MDEKITLPVVKTREQLLDDFKEVKENPYWIILRLPLILLGVILWTSYFPNDKGSNTPLFFFIIYVFIELILILEQIKKKIDILYAIEKNRVVEIHKDSTK